MPNACCGLIGGSGNNILAARPVRNEGTDTRMSCRPSPNDIVQAVQLWQQQGQGLCGMYRSCLTTDDIRPAMFAGLLATLKTAVPSAYACPDELLCLVINLGTDGRLETLAFRQRQDSWEETTLVLVEETRRIA